MPNMGVALAGITKDTKGDSELGGSGAAASKGEVLFVLPPPRGSYYPYITVAWPWLSRPFHLPCLLPMPSFSQSSVSRTREQTQQKKKKKKKKGTPKTSTTLCPGDPSERGYEGQP
jgi:hypothetical protein